MSLKGKEKYFITGKLLYPIVTAISWGVYFFLLGGFAKSGIYLYNITFYFETSILTFLIIYVLVKKTPINIKNHNKITITYGILAGIFSGLGSLFFVLATEHINSAIVSSINSTQIIFSAILAFIFFNERLTRLQILGIVIVFVTLALFELLSI